jgi:hypothetical protein
MRHASLLLLILAAAPVLAQAGDHGKGVTLSSDQCGFSTPYDVRISPAGLQLDRKDDSPRTVFLHDGTLRVDGQLVQVDPADAERLRRIEATSREMLPQIDLIAREAVGISFDALAGAMQVMTGDARKTKQLDAYRKRALAHLDHTLARGVWEQAAFEAQFEAEIEQAAEEMAGAMTRGVLWTVFTGGAGRMERRAEALEKELDARIEARSEALETQAQALCVKVQALDALQRELDVRVQGRPLELLKVKASKSKGQDAANRLTSR